MPKAGEYERMSELVSDLVRGSIDLHVHAGPDGVAPRHGTAFDVVTAARNAGIGALVLKNKQSGTGALAALLNALVPEVRSIGALTLDHHVGGLNPAAVAAEASLGSRVVWMPTHDAANALRARKSPHGPGITVLDEHDRLVDAVGEVLCVVQEHDMLLCTGHLGRNEVFALVREARRRRTNTVVTHPLVGITELTLDEQRELAELGAFMEYTFVSAMPNHSLTPVASIAAAIRAVGVGRCVISTDFGQIHNPMPAEGMWMAVANLVRQGFSSQEITSLVRTTPAELLGRSGRACETPSNT